MEKLCSSASLPLCGKSECEKCRSAAAVLEQISVGDLAVLRRLPIHPRLISFQLTSEQPGNHVRSLDARPRIEKQRTSPPREHIFDSLDDESFKLLETAILDRSLTWTVILATRDHDVTKRCDQIIELAPCHLNDGTSSESETQRLQNRS